MATLKYNIGATDPIILVASPEDAAKGLRFRIDDELLDLTNFDKSPYRAGTRPNLFGLDNTRWIVNRGVGGTVPASHSAGATITAAISAVVSGDSLEEPDPFPATGSGAVDSVNGQTGVVVLDAEDVGAVDSVATTAFGLSLLEVADAAGLAALLTDYFVEPPS